MELVLLLLKVDLIIKKKDCKKVLLLSLVLAILK